MMNNATMRRVKMKLHQFPAAADGDDDLAAGDVDGKSPGRTMTNQKAIQMSPTAPMTWKAMRQL